jgi:cytochrome c biogenesis protein CcdA
VAALALAVVGIALLDSLNPVTDRRGRLPVLLICAGAVVWWRGDTLAARDPAARGKPREGRSAVVLGAGIAGVELLTAFPYFAAIAMVLSASVSLTGKVSLLVLYNVIYVLPLIVIVIVCAVMGEKGGRVLTPVSDWIAMHWPMVVAPVAGTAGAALTTYGILKLT